MLEKSVNANPHRNRVYSEGKNMRYLICDDDATFALRLKQRLTELLDGIQKKPSIDCVSQINEISTIDIRKYDVAFLDIDMGKINGIELAKQFRLAYPDIILIFVTNYVQYSLEGYEVRALRYLLKEQLDEKLPECLEAALRFYRKERNYIRFSSDNEEIDILPGHIVYAETDARRIKLHLKNDVRDALMLSITMARLTELLVNRGFLRIHQSYLVNMAYIQRIKSTGVWLSDGTALPISARNYNELKQEYLRWKGLKRWSMQ